MDACSDLRLMGQNFANSLVAGDFNAAHQMLTNSAKTTWTQEILRETYAQMISYFPEPPSIVEVGMTLEASACHKSVMKPGDIGVVYVSIHSEDEGEGVLVVVCKEGEHLLIRDIEWGRP